MPKKKFVLRIDESTMKAVEKWAADEFRSINGQLEWMITKSLRDSRRLRPSTKEQRPGKTPPSSKKEKD